MYILGLCKVGLSETFMQLFGSPQQASSMSSSLLAGPVLDLLLDTSAQVLVVNEVGSFAANGFHAGDAGLTAILCSCLVRTEAMHWKKTSP